MLLKNDPARCRSSAKRVYVAGSNADNIGNQAGGWTLTWQGGSTNKIPGTTILDGIRAHSAGNVTYSEDASAPIPANATGIVVVGETPYSEGFGDVGGPRWAYDPGDNGVPRPIKDMQLSGADKPAVDKVCAATTRCVVVIVSGRPLILDPSRLARIDGLVAAWLPGSEGTGVADPLFGTTPVHGQAAGDLAALARPGADQRRRRGLRPAVPVRVRAHHALRAVRKMGETPHARRPPQP